MIYNNVDDAVAFCGKIYNYNYSDDFIQPTQDNPYPTDCIIILLENIIFNLLPEGSSTPFDYFEKNDTNKFKFKFNRANLITYIDDYVKSGSEIGGCYFMNKNRP